MAKFLTRVELHNANAVDYEKLHAAMAKQKFSRIIVDDNGTRYHLPTAEYCSVGTLIANDVVNLAKIAIAETGKTGGVITVEYTVGAWNGLARA